MRTDRWVPEIVLAAIITGILLLASVGILAAVESRTAPAARSPVSAELSVPGRVVVGSPSQATAISSAFWGLDVAARQPFNAVDAASVAATPVTYLVFPSGNLGEEFNYTSGVLTASNGTETVAATSAQTFVTSCRLIACEAILQLPAEIDDPAIAAVYAYYVVHTLGFQPAYWQIGNDPSGWTHFDVPWALWGTEGGGNTTPLAFADLVHAYIAAVLLVDPSAQFLALGAGMGGKEYDQSWVKDLATVDGHELAGISVHSYILGPRLTNPTDSDLFANLNGPYSLPDQLAADRIYIQEACPSCTHLQVFVTEINAGEDDRYGSLLTTFAGTLYLAAETVQGLTLQATNLDWFAYDSHYDGAWSMSPLQWQSQYYLFRDIMTQLETDTLPTVVTGPPTFYAIASYDEIGLSLLLVNVNTTTAVDVNVSQSGLGLGRPGVLEYSWSNATTQPVESSLNLSDKIQVPAESILLLKVAPGGESATFLSGAPPAISEELTPGIPPAGNALGTTLAIIPSSFVEAALPPRDG